MSNYRDEHGAEVEYNSALRGGPGSTGEALFRTYLIETPLAISADLSKLAEASASTSAATGYARSREKALVRKDDAIVSPPERPKGRPAVYWVRIEAPCRGCLKIAREVEQMLLGRGCKFEVTSNREMLARIRRGLRTAIAGEPQAPARQSTAALADERRNSHE